MVNYTPNSRTEDCPICRAHPDMRRVMDAAFWMAKTEYPVFFEDMVTEELWEKEITKG